MAAPDFSDAQLFRTKPEEYKDGYVDHLLEQYKLYVQSHERVSERREGANKFFLTLNSAVVAALAYILKEDKGDRLLLLAVAVAAMSICVYWYRAIRAYDNLNTGKFKVIHAIEKRLPLALYETEWQVLGEGQDPALYKPVSHLERIIPLTFAGVYGVILAIRLIWW